MKTLNVFPIWSVVEILINQELAKQGMHLVSGKVKHTRTGKLTIEVMTEEFFPAMTELLSIKRRIK